MNRVIMDVFPTPWSPKKTSLYLASGEILTTGGIPCPFPNPPEADVDAIINRLLK